MSHDESETRNGIVRAIDNIHPGVSSPQLGHAHKRHQWKRKTTKSEQLSLTG